MFDRKMPFAVLLILVLAMLSACGGSTGMYLPTVLENPQDYNGKDITIDGAYVARGADINNGVLAMGFSTLDNGLDAQPFGEQIWLENFPQDAANGLHHPGDSIYGMVRVSGRFEAAGNYGPEGQYKYRLAVSSASPLQTVVRTEQRVGNKALGDGKINFVELSSKADQYNGQTVTTQAYYFWNGALAVLAEGISTEEDGGSPQPVGEMVWVDGFPPELSAELNLGPNNSYVWGKIEATGYFQTGGNFGHDGSFPKHFQIESANIVR
jgi:hypothetical protein